jgi:hypothetical protein
MAERYLEYWANYEWLEHRGHDETNRGDYPESFLPFLPPDRIGSYDAVGWAGNGGGGFEYDPDPVRGSGQNMMYKGYLNLAISLYGYVSGDDRFDRPFEVVYDDDWKFEYDHRALNEMIAEQWRQSWPGIVCEAGKIFSWCSNLGGTAVKIFDAMHGTDCFVPYENFKRFAEGPRLPRQQGDRANRRGHALPRPDDRLLRQRARAPAVGQHVAHHVARPRTGPPAVRARARGHDGPVLA